jgi:hypothetical protein
VAEAGLGVAPTLIALASAYQLAQYRVSRNAERAAQALWLAQRPLTDSELSAWMSSWNGLLAGHSATQANITTAYMRTALSQFGAVAPTALTPPTADASSATEWLDSTGRLASPALRAQVAAARDAMEAGEASIAQAALLDRTPLLASPVVKQRWHVSQGETFDTGLQTTSSFVRDSTYTSGRVAEQLVMGARNWPAFKNGVAMLYKRIPQATACGWCILVSTRLYSLASFKASAEWHAHCHCSWAPVTLPEAQAYASGLAEGGDYYAAAARIGLWSGPAPTDYRVIERQRATTGGAVRGKGAPSVPVTPNPNEAQAVELVAQANRLNARARAAVAAGDSPEAKRLYTEASGLTAQALRLRRA